MESIHLKGDPERCVVILPGLRYFSQAPLLWFAREAAQARGWSVLEVSERAPAGEEPFAWMHDRATRALDLADAGTIAVVGKSLASAAAPLVGERTLPAVWLTPLLIRPAIVEALVSVTAPTLAVGGTADASWTDGPALQPSALLDVLELEGLDHSLQVPGDVGASLGALRQVTERVGAFLDRVG